MHFFISFPLETDFFFANFEWNPECTTESNQMNSSNTVSIQGLRPDISHCVAQENAHRQAL